MTAPALSRGPGSSGGSRGDSLSARLSAEQSTLRMRSTATAGLAVIAVVAAAGAAGALLLGDGRWLAWPRLVPALIWLGGAAVALAVARWLRTRDADALSLTSLARAIEREQSLRAGSLRGALEVAHSGPLGAHAAQDVARRLAPDTLAPRLGQQLARALAVTAAAAVVGAALLTLSARTSRDGFAAVLHPIRAFRGTLLPALAFDRLPASVPRGMPLTIRVRADGRQSVTVSQHAAGEPWRDTTLVVDDATGIARLALGPVRAPVMLRVQDGRAPAAEATVAVDERGWIGDVALYAQYPAYLGRTNETLDAVSPIRVPRGTRVRVSAVLRGGVTAVQLRSAVAGQPETLVDVRPAIPAARGAASATAVDPRATSDGQPVSAEISLDRDGTWQWRGSAAQRANGETLPPELPDSMLFVVVPDKLPEIIIASPMSDTAIGTTGVVPVIVRAGDDHGIGSIALTVWRERAISDTARNSRRPGERERIDIADPAAPFFEGGVTVALDGRDLEPGDRLHLVAVAIDDSPWRQQSSSTEVILRVPTVSEQRSMARSLADSLAARALQMAQQEKRLQQNTADASRSRDLKGGGRGEEQPGGAKTDGSKASMSFQAAEKARQLGREQQQMGAKIDSLRQSAKELENRLKSAGALDSALSNRMRDIQKMLRDAMTPEMQKQLDALNKSTERLSGTEAQQSMEQLAQQQQQLRQQLEKSAEMLKRAALEGAMSTLRDEAKDLADAQKQMANQQKQGKTTPTREEAKSLADRSRALQDEVDRLAKRLDEAGAKPGANKTRAAQPMLDQATEAMDRAAREALQNAAEQAERNESGGKPGDPKTGKPQPGDKTDPNAKPGDQGAADKAAQAAQALQDEKDKTAAQARAGDDKTAAGAAAQSGNSAERKSGAQSQGPQGGGQQSGGQQQGQQGKPQPGQQGQQGQQGQGGQQGGAGENAQRAGEAMDKAAQQLSSAREAQVDAWKTELSQQLDQSINETMQLARQQADLEQRARQSGNAQSMQGEQGALQQGVQQAAERLEQAGRTSSLLSQRSQKAMADAQRRVSQATQQMGQPGGNQQAQSAMKDASEALNQALSSLVRDRERVNNAQSASGFTEMMEQLKQLAQQQGALNGQMQGLNLLPGGAQGDAAKQQARVLARQQRDVAKSLTDVSDADQTGRTDALAKEAQMLAQQIERAGIDPSVAARQQQLYRRLLDAGRFLEQDERDDQGPREAKSGSANGARLGVDGPQSGKAANKFAPPTWNELRGLGAEDRRMVIEYFRRLNGSNP